MKRYWMGAWLVALVAVAGVVLARIEWGDSRGPAVDETPIRIALQTWPGYAHAYLAEKMGMFTKNGVAVRLVPTRTQPESVARYESGDVDGIFDVFANTITQVSKGIRTKVVYVTDYSQSGDVIVGRPEFTSLADLKGHRMSFEAVNSYSHLYVLKALEGVGLDESEVNFELVAAQDVLQALEKGHIDAGHTWQPMTRQAEAKGYRILSKAGDIPGIITAVLAFHARVIQQRPEAVRAVVQSLLEANAYATLHPQESLPIMAGAMGLSVEEMAMGLAEIASQDLRGNLLAMTRSDRPDSLYGSGGIITRFLLSRGQLQSIPDLDEVIDPRFLIAPR